MTKRLLNLRVVITLVVFITSLFPFAFHWRGGSVLAQGKRAELRLIRSISTGEFGLTSPKGMAFSSTANSFILLGSEEASVSSISLYGAFNGTGEFSGSLGNYLNIAFDQKSGALFTLNQSAEYLSKIQVDRKGIPVHANSSLQYAVGSLNLRTAQGITFDPGTGRLFVLTENPARLMIVSPDPQYGFDGEIARKKGRVRQVSVQVTDTALQGIAFNPVNKHVYVGSPIEQAIYEITEQGALVNVYDVSGLNLKNPGSMLFAPSRDVTDNPATMNLYILDLGVTSLQSAAGGSTNTTSDSVNKTQDAQIVELSSVQAMALPPQTTLISMVLERTIDTSNASWNPSAPDTSGVTYWPSRDQLFIVDSEVDEMPNYFVGKNVYFSTRSGTLVSTCSTTTYNNEPTGTAINPNNNHLFITSDSGSGWVFEIDLGPDGTYCTADDIRTNLSLSFITGMDAEDVAYGQNKLFLAGGVNAEVYYFDLGLNGVIGGGDDGPIGQFDTAALGFSDLEGIGYSRYNGTLLLVSNGSDTYIGETTLTGTLLRAYDLSSVSAIRRSDVDHAPGSNNPSLNNFYVASRGVDNNADPNENDGKIWEFKINTPFTSTPSNTPTRTPTPTATNTPNPNGTATFTPTSTFTPSATNTATPLPSTNPLVVSFASNGSVGGFSFADEDILRFDGSTWSMLFDGSDVGVGGVDVFGFYKVDSDTFLMSFDKAVTVNGLSFSPSDVAQFDATLLGSVTAGTFSMYFNGVDVGLDTTAEKIDAVDILPDGRILISTIGNPSVPNGAGGTLLAADEDILAFTPTTLGNTTSGSWSMYFDGSDVGLADSTDEDIDALEVTPNGDIYLSTLGLFSVPGISGDDEDVFKCTPTSLGDNTICGYSSPLYFDGSTWGLAANDVDALGLETTVSSPTSTPTVTLTPTITSIPTNTFTATATASPSPTFTSTNTPTAGPSPTPTDTPTPTATFTATSTPTATWTPTATFTPTNTPTPTATFTATLIPTATWTPTATFTPTNTPLPSATFTASPTSSLPDLIFSDGFEAGNLSAWTSSSTNNGSLSVGSTSALVGSYGMQAVISGQTNMYVRDDSPVAEARYRARFYVDPNSISMVNGDNIYILQGYATGTNTIMLRVEISINNGLYRVRLKVLNDSGVWLNTAYTTISDAPHLIELDWLAANSAGANDGQVVLWVDDVQQGSVIGIDNDTYRMDSVRFGTVYLGSATMSGTIYFDAYESRRQTYIGP